MHQLQARRHFKCLSQGWKWSNHTQKRGFMSPTNRIQGFLKVHYRKGSKQVELFHYIIIIIIHLLFHYNKVRGKIKREEGQGWWENAYLSCSYLLVSYEKTVGMLVFTCNFIVGDQIHQLTDKAHHLLVPGHVGHGKTARRTLSTVGNTLWKQRQFQAYSNVTE